MPQSDAIREQRNDLWAFGNYVGLSFLIFFLRYSPHWPRLINDFSIGLVQSLVAFKVDELIEFQQNLHQTMAMLAVVFVAAAISTKSIGFEARISSYTPIHQGPHNCVPKPILSIWK